MAGKRLITLFGMSSHTSSRNFARAEKESYHTVRNGSRPATISALAMKNAAIIYHFPLGNALDAFSTNVRIVSAIFRGCGKSGGQLPAWRAAAHTIEATSTRGLN
jgi:hypothetical protein